MDLAPASGLPRIRVALRKIQAASLGCDAQPDDPRSHYSLSSYAKFYSRPHDAVIRVYDEAGNVIETHEQALKQLVGTGP